MVHIPHVEAEFLGPADGVASVTLRPAADARSHLMAARLFGGVERQVLYQQGARADERHVAFEDVDELGQLVDGGGADEATDLREALGVGQEVALGITLVGHGLELDDAEHLAVQAGPLL